MPANFSNRLLAHPQIAVWPSQKGTSTKPFVLAVVDQLLVDGSVRDTVLHALTTRGGVPGGPYQAAVIGSVFQSIPGLPEIDVIKVQDFSPTDKGPAKIRTISGIPAVFGVTDQLRTVLAAAHIANPRLVTPNHVLVPAGTHGAGCPAGPPSEAPDVSLAPPYGPSPEVTVIDSGFINLWEPKKIVDPWGHQWGPWPQPSQLAGLCDVVSVNRADWLPGSQTITQLTQATTSTALAANANGNWQQGTPDCPSTQYEHVLDALAGHANFVTGLIGQYCHWPRVHLWSHKGSFVNHGLGSDEFSCEASVCRSIIQSQVKKRTELIHIGFAFPLQPPDPQASPPQGQGVLSVVWDAVFEFLSPNRPLVIAPAGNETDTALYLPAGLDALYPSAPFTGGPAGDLYDNVKGVASLQPETFAGSTFSNRGSWVSCSAVGEEVQSTFIPVSNVMCEDDGSATVPRPIKNFTDGWATWQGTSFAAPKVAGALAARIALGASQQVAWNSLVAVYGGPAKDPQFGWRLTNL